MGEGTVIRTVRLTPHNWDIYFDNQLGFRVRPAGPVFEVWDDRPRRSRKVIIRATEIAAMIYCFEQILGDEKGD